MSNTGTTGRIPLWLVGTEEGTLAIGAISCFFYGFLCWFRFFSIIKFKFFV
uniref:photosystem II reaction center protein J n=1 Tax=Chlamydomonas reinhardtii TaxID=3055 RepID=UPI00000963CA|nr:photosystem II reaction center protein J [Chlamydomonas reinhardtii]AAC16327.1 PsbJ [Chlamydomonas reinhardtii]6KAF_J Chain J, Photosystem II reaction center protein J, PsbJ [Chlamydomonas reinhardtii]6KAF_j Chain j, Photosystem II reaction center protein J, PsbJ [Chlamydomonas reinhardtii]DAA00963.1 TPA_inf: photosystem II reaction center protein J [Chlamydomonas reinhardtii]|eukprot:NP_958419.1 photosystem II reaction center protein J (chloroplast) [Chlamydomonas reinhardtii]